MISLQKLFKRDSLNNQGDRLSKIARKQLLNSTRNAILTLLAFHIFRHNFFKILFFPWLSNLVAMT